jgi:hypothetical protein
MTTVTAGFSHCFLSLKVLVPQRTGLQKQFSVSAGPVPRITEETQGPWTHEPHCSLITGSCLSLVPRPNTHMTSFVSFARISESWVSHEMADHSPFMHGTRRIHTKLLCRQVRYGCWNSRQSWLTVWLATGYLFERENRSVVTIGRPWD